MHVALCSGQYKDSLLHILPPKPPKLCKTRVKHGTKLARMDHIKSKPKKGREGVLVSEAFFTIPKIDEVMNSQKPDLLMSPPSYLGCL